MRRVESGRDAQSMVLYGLRGAGKTVLLARFARRARDRGWLVAHVEAKTGRSVRELVGEAFHDTLADLARPDVGERVLRALKTALSFKATYDSAGRWSFGLDLDAVPGGGADSGSLELDLARLLHDLGGVAHERGVGVALLVDEAQDLPDEELVALCSVVHQAHQRGDRLVLALAGLPSLPRRLAEAKSYAERLFDYRDIGALDHEAAVAALAEPASAEGVRWQDDALELVVAEARGYTYFLQQYGKDTWNAADVSPITLSDARLGVARGLHALDSGFFRVRWDRATPAEKDYLRAMALDGDAGSTTGAVASRRNRRVSSLGPARASLMGKGLVYSPEPGVVAFTVPGMAAFVRRQPVEV